MPNAREDSRLGVEKQNNLSLLNEQLLGKKLSDVTPCILSKEKLNDNELDSNCKARRAYSRIETHIDPGVYNCSSQVADHETAVDVASSGAKALNHCDLPQSTFVSDRKKAACASSPPSPSFRIEDEPNSRKVVPSVCNTEQSRSDKEGELSLSLSPNKGRYTSHDECGLAAVNDANSYSLLRMLRLQRCFEENLDVLYNFCSLYVSEWPLLTLEWIPALTIIDSSCNYTLKYLAVGMQSAKGVHNHVQLMEIALPDVHRAEEGSNNVDVSHESSVMDPGTQFQHVRGHCCFQRIIPVDAPVLKIRAAPMDSHIIAVKTGSGFIGVYNLPQDGNIGGWGQQQPLHRIGLRGHRTGGFGLSWNLVKMGLLASGGDDCYINCWDIRHAVESSGEGTHDNGATVQSALQTHSVLPDSTGNDAWPIYRFLGHRDVVTDVSWHASEAHLLVSAGLDGDVRFWDVRLNTCPTTLAGAHKGGATAAQFHPTGFFQLVTAGLGGELSFWDTRWPKEAFMTIHYHQKAVTGLQWSPFSEAILGSFSEDGQAVIWDLDKTHLPPGYSQEDVAPPELAFVHIGHLGPVTDLAWCPDQREAWMMASADALNGVHVYRPKMGILRDYVATL